MTISIAITQKGEPMSRYIDADLLMPNAEHKGRYDVVSAYDIANTPTADVRENVRGHWIRIAPRYYKCSECGVRVNSSFANFCHRCGSDMRGEKNGDIY